MASEAFIYVSFSVNALAETSTKGSTLISASTSFIYSFERILRFCLYNGVSLQKVSIFASGILFSRITLL